MKKITIYTDGGSRGNPGPAAAGAVFYNEKSQVFKKYSQYLGDKLTNNEAEYLAVIFALEKFKQVFGKKIAKISEIDIKSDSELFINQLNGKYKVMDPEIQQLFIKVWNLKMDFKKVKFFRVSREKNKEADFLVNEALDNAGREKQLL